MKILRQEDLNGIKFVTKSKSSFYRQKEIWKIAADIYEVWGWRYESVGQLRGHLLRKCSDFGVKNFGEYMWTKQNFTPINLIIND